MIQAKVILPRAFKVEVFRAELTPVVKDIMEEIKDDYAKTEATWHTKPTWGTQLEQKPDSIIGRVWTENDIVKFLDKGTRVRYATMSRDFQPKTKVRWLGSGPGAGRMLFVSKKYPRPGIKAREWTKMIKEIIQPKLKANAQAALNKAAKESGHGVK